MGEDCENIGFPDRPGLGWGPVTACEFRRYVMLNNGLCLFRIHHNYEATERSVLRSAIVEIPVYDGSTHSKTPPDFQLRYSEGRQLLQCLHLFFTEVLRMSFVEAPFLRPRYFSSLPLLYEGSFKLGNASKDAEHQ